MNDRIECACAECGIHAIVIAANLAPQKLRYFCRNYLFLMPGEQQ